MGKWLVKDVTDPREVTTVEVEADSAEQAALIAAREGNFIYVPSGNWAYVYRMRGKRVSAHYTVVRLHKKWVVA